MIFILKALSWASFDIVFSRLGINDIGVPGMWFVEEYTDQEKWARRMFKMAAILTRPAPARVRAPVPVRDRSDVRTKHGNHAHANARGRVGETVTFSTSC